MATVFRISRIPGAFLHLSCLDIILMKFEANWVNWVKKRVILKHIESDTLPADSWWLGDIDILIYYI